MLQLWRRRVSTLLFQSDRATANVPSATIKQTAQTPLVEAAVVASATTVEKSGKLLLCRTQ